MAESLIQFHRFFNRFSSSWGSFPANASFNFAFHNLFSYHFYIFRAQGIMANCNPHLHTMFSFAIPTLLNFLVLKFQNLKKSPFETRPNTILFVILSFLLYCLSYDYLQRLQLPPRSSSSALLARVFRCCTQFFGYMGIACLASLLFPESVSPAFYAIYVVVSVGDLLYLLFQRIKRRFRGRRFQGQGNLLPL